MRTKVYIAILSHCLSGIHYDPQVSYASESPATMFLHSVVMQPSNPLLF